MKRSFLWALLIALASIGYAQAQTSITGKVTDAKSGEAVPFASVVVKGTTIGVNTDINGNYSISVPATATTLVFSEVGHADMEVDINGRTIINAAMEPGATQLDEVVVIAYGTSKREAITGSVTTMNATEIERRPVANISAAMQGLGTGIIVSNSYGEPGNVGSVRIRGFGSITGNNDPLYVVDGAPYSGSINAINPNDIENISVLKDAASAALYGARAASGVILITTKSGKGKSSLRLNVQQGLITRGMSEYDRMEANDWMQAMFTGYANGVYRNNEGISMEDAISRANQNFVKDIIIYNIYDKGDLELFGSDGKFNPNAKILPGIAGDLNWFKDLERTGYRQEYNVSGSGSTDKLNAYFSAGYLGENGYVILSDYKRFTGRARLEYKPKDYIKMGMNINGMHSIADVTTGSGTGYANVFYMSRSMAPIYPVHLHDLTTGEYIRDENGNIQYDPGDLRPQSLGRHTIWERKLNYERTYQNQLQAVAYADIYFLKDFTFTVRANVMNRNTENMYYTNATIGDGKGLGRLGATNYRYKDYTISEELKWNRQFNDHALDAIVIHEASSYGYRYSYLYKQDESMPNVYEFSNFATMNSLSGYESMVRREGYLGRLRYSYKEKYFADASIRRDASSKFHKDYRWGTFMSFGASWTVSKENFMKNINWADNLKLRASYGQVGNDAGTGYYGWMALYGLTSNNGEGAAYRTSYADPTTKWESVNNFTVGLEGRLFKRLNFTIEYFDKRHKDLLFDVTRPLSSGSTTTGSGEAPVTRNAGTNSNRGVEIELRYDIVKNRDWNWNVGVYATFLKNKIIKLPKQMQAGYITGTKRWVEGKSQYEFWSYQWAGVDQLDGVGLFVLDPEKEAEAITTPHYREINGKKYTSLVSYALRDFSGSSVPKVFGNINSSLSYKNLSLYVLCTYSLGGKVNDTNYSSLMSVSQTPSARHKDLAKAWNGRPAGISETSANRIDPNGTPVIDAGTSSWGTSNSTRFLFSRSYFAVQNISLQYDVPKRIIEKLNLSSVNIGANVENLLLLSAHKGLDPQQSFNGTVDNQFLPQRVFTLSLNIAF